VEDQNQIYDPATNAFSMTGASDTRTPFNRSATLLMNGKVLFAGARTPSTTRPGPSYMIPRREASLRPVAWQRPVCPMPQRCCRTEPS
jgi:hypothetical protein